MTQLLRRICRALHRRPDADLRRRVKDIAILQIRQDAYEKIRKSGISLRRQRFVHSGLMVPRSQVPPTHHSIRSDPDALRRLLALSDLPVTPVTACSRGQSGCDASPRRLPLLTHLQHREHLAVAAKRIAGGAGARPDHQIGGRRLVRSASSKVQPYRSRLQSAVRFRSVR
jgi:hypothetical protein